MAVVLLSDFFLIVIFLSCLLSFPYFSFLLVFVLFHFFSLLETPLAEKSSFRRRRGEYYEALTFSYTHSLMIQMRIDHLFYSTSNFFLDRKITFCTVRSLLFICA